MLIGCGVAVFWLAAWYALAAGVNKPYLLPGPQAVAVTLLKALLVLHLLLQPGYPLA